jgi:hypothetical protein
MRNIVSSTKMFQNVLRNIFTSRKQILFPQQCFPGWANWETLTGSEMIPSLPRALAFISCHLTKNITIFEKGVQAQ